MSKQERISIIIPFVKPNYLTFKCIDGCFKQDYPDFEIILLPDNSLSTKDIEKIKGYADNYKVRFEIIATGHVFPSAKRNLGISRCTGTILAFIDDDATPRSDWLSRAYPIITIPEIGALGGPSSPDPGSPAKELAADFIMNSDLATKSAYKMTSKRLKVKGGYLDVIDATELPACNLFVRKDVYIRAGRFDESLLVAEDVKLCINIKKDNKSIIFCRELGVVHRCRPLFADQAKRVYCFARHRIRLMLKDWGSFKPIFFFPSLFTVGIICGIPLSLFFRPAAAVYILVLFAYLVVVINNSLKAQPRLRLYAFLGTPLIHLSYGVGFIVGLFEGVTYGYR